MNVRMRIYLYSFLAVLATYPGTAFTQQSADGAGAAAAAEPISIVAAAFEAFNRHDIEGVVAHFAPSVAVVHVMNRRFDETMNPDAWRARLSGIFAQAPDLRWELLTRVVEGPFVLDHYRIHAGGRSGAEMQMYEVQGGKIVNVWHFQSSPPATAHAH